MPIIAAATAVIRTAAAAMSFTIPAFGLNAGETKSTSFSIDELKSSATKTIAIAEITHNHSFIVKFT